MSLWMRGAACVAAAAIVVATPVQSAWARGSEPVDEGDELEQAAEAEAAEGDGESETDPITKSLIDDAVAHFKEGRRLYEDRSYEDAADAFRRSYESVPSGQALYNESLAWEKAGERARALQALDRYLALPDCVKGELLCAVERDSASRASQKLKPLVGELDIVLEPGASIRGVEIGGELHGPTAFPVYVEPGVLEVVAVGTKENQRRRFEVDVDPGRRAALVIPARLFNEDGGVVTPIRNPESNEGNGSTAPRRNPELRRRSLRAAFYGSLGVTIGSGVALGVVGGLLLDAHRDYERRCTGTCVPGVDEYPSETERRFNRLKPVTTGLVIATSALALVTVTLALFAFIEGDRAQQRASTRARNRGPQFTGNGLRIRW
jgi:hypothetical protein